MTSPSPQQADRLTVSELKGLNEREQHTQSDLGNFDILRGAVPLNKNSLIRANGNKLLLTFAEPVLGIYQTNDSRGNIIVQLRNSVQLVTEEELFGQAAIPSNLTPIATTEEESMSQAIIVHTTAAGTSGGGYTPANTWVQAPLSAILSQLNPDGTAAAFVTALAANQFTLAAGVYRIKGWCILFNNTAATRMAVRLYNVTTAAAAFAGAANETSFAFNTAGSDNISIFFTGNLNLAVPTTFELQASQNRVQATSGFGLALNTGAAPAFTLPRELFRMIEILKTA